MTNYVLQPQDGNAGGLEADRELSALEWQWADVFPGNWEDDADQCALWEDTEWLDWLVENPLKSACGFSCGLCDLCVLCVKRVLLCG